MRLSYWTLGFGLFLVTVVSDQLTAYHRRSLRRWVAGRYESPSAWDGNPGIDKSRDDHVVWTIGEGPRIFSLR